MVDLLVNAGANPNERPMAESVPNPFDALKDAAWLSVVEGGASSRIGRAADCARVRSMADRLLPVGRRDNPARRRRA